MAIRLGLIGDNIAASRAPDLHRTAGRLCGLDVTYDLFVPKELSLGFDAVFDRAHDLGYRGLNITYPYKERVVARVDVKDARIRAIAACNTALFQGSETVGENTDYSGFVRAFRTTFGPASPGIVAMAGCGGVGKAIGFALADLGAKALRLFDRDSTRAQTLSRSLAAVFPSLETTIVDSIDGACGGADGLVNATPMGMAGHDGNAFPMSALRGQRWVFDAVYTPVDTPLVTSARAAGLPTMSGFELYFFQGVDAFRIFTQQDVDPVALRAAILKSR